MNVTYTLPIYAQEPQPIHQETDSSLANTLGIVKNLYNYYLGAKLFYKPQKIHKIATERFLVTLIFYTTSIIIE